MCDLMLNSQELFTIGWDENRAGTVESTFVDEKLSKHDKRKIKDSSTRKRPAPQNSKTKKQPSDHAATVKKGGTPLAKRKTCPDFVLDVGGDRSKNRSSAATKKWAAPETPPFLKHILASYDLDFQKIVAEDDFNVDEEKKEKIIPKTTPTRPRPVDFTILLRKPSSKIDLLSFDKDQSTSAMPCSSENKIPPRTTDDQKPASKIDQSKKAKEDELDDDDDSIFDHSSFLATIDKMVEEAVSKKSKSRVTERAEETKSKKSHLSDKGCTKKPDLEPNFDDDDEELFERSSFLARLNHIEKAAATQKSRSQQGASLVSKNCLILDNFTQISTPLDASTPISSLRRRSARLTGLLPKQRLNWEEDSQEILITRKSNPTSMAEGGFDACECLFSQEAAMRRLLSLLRSSQGYCTDNECTQDFNGPQGAGAGLFGGSMYTIMMMWMVAALALFFLRPASLRRRGGDRKPPPSSDNDDSRNDPAPPIQ
uniref:Small integral membrane protein 14 n=1 Tax=Romanomermis culicivorax TaxID=13658 RepID=A0A915JUY9_ROMCU